MKFGESLSKIASKILAKFHLRIEKVKPKKIEKVRPKGAVILIDGENLYQSLADLGGLGKDYGMFKNRLIREGEKLFTAPFYFISVTTDISSGTLGFFEHLQQSGYEIRSVPLGGGKEPKSEIDPEVAVELCRFATEKGVDVIVLVSGDHHFVPAVKYAQEKGRKVRVVSTPSALSEQLKKVADEWIDLKQIIQGIPQTEIEKRREETLKKINEGKKVDLSTLKETS